MRRQIDMHPQLSNMGEKLREAYNKKTGYNPQHTRVHSTLLSDSPATGEQLLIENNNSPCGGQYRVCSLLCSLLLTPCFFEGHE